MTPVAITGMGAVSALGVGVGALTTAMRAGVSGIRPLSPEGADGLIAPIGALLDPDAIERSIATLRGVVTVEESVRRLARRASWGMRALLLAVAEAWNASQVERRVAKDRIGLVVAGNNLDGRLSERMHRDHARGSGHVNPRFAVECLDSNYVATISEALGLRGPGSTVGAASASGNAAVLRACEMLELSSCDVCVVAAPVMELSAAERRALQNAGALYAGPGPADQACRPFDSGHAGLVYGEAAACVVIEGEHALGSRRVLARVVGGAMCLDASSTTRPNARGELRAMQQALETAGLRADDLNLVSAHGTSSPLGDRTELEALSMLFGRGWGSARINSLKGLSGHCLSSASLLELIAVVVQLGDGFVHGNINLRDPLDPTCPMPREAEGPLALRFGLNNGFAFGGINSSVVVERGEH